MSSLDFQSSSTRLNFEFATATRVVFGNGSSDRIAGFAAEMGRHAALVTGGSPERHGALLQQLRQAGLQVTTCQIVGEPTIAAIDEAKALAAGCDLVIAVGGGSALDGGKALAALIPNAGEILDYLEVIGQGKKLDCDPLPFIAVPTSAGAGAEATKNAVLASPEHRVKVSLRDNRMLPDLALVDPLLTHSLPPALTATTGMDALTQLLEPYVSPFANPITDGFCGEGLRRVGTSLRRAYAKPEDAAAREDMALASLLGGMALANAKLGAVHGFAGVLGGMYAAPHGAICAALLPAVMKANMAALEEREPEHPALGRLDQIARWLLDDADARADDALAWIEETRRSFDIPALGAYGLRAADFDEIVEKSSISSSMKGNPIALTHSELRSILEAAH